MIERYLAAPTYGERWGKYWLDAAGYADSNGYFSADSDRPLAYRYRDYVIASFNADKPYDRFVREQLAGDELCGFVPGGDVTAAQAEALTATHFLRNAPDGTGESDGNPDEVRLDRYTVLEGTLQLSMSSLLGVTIQCARCHDHKFEPITQEEYYSLQAIFFGAYNPARWTKPNERTLTLATKAEREDHQRQTERVEQQLKVLRDGLESVAVPLRRTLIEERLRKLNPDVRLAVLQAVDAPKAKLSPEQKDLLKKHVEPLKIGDDDVAKRSPEYATKREEAHRLIAAREKERPRPLDKLAVLTDIDPQPPAHHLLVRGQYNLPGKEVHPGVPAAFSTSANVFRQDALPAEQKSSGRRAAFARWVTAPDHPLFARTMVNRLWQHHFGVGLVATPDNLGKSGARPSHPEVLDWLATEFIHSGWSIKTLHRLILHSAVYRQTSAPRADALAQDANNRLLWRFPRRRIDAEALRDALLAVSEELDRRTGGPYVPTRRTGEGSVEIDEKHEGARRRSVYLQQRRTQVTTLLELFDAPSVTINCGVRHTSTVPLQALALLNSDFVRQRAIAFAGRLEREAGADAAKRLRLAFRLALGRGPSDREWIAAERFLETQRTLYKQEKDGDRRVWTDFCQMLLASNAFLYVE